MTVDALTCVSCGACCISDWDDPGYVALTAKEAGRLSKWKQKHWIHHDDGPRDDSEFLSLRTKDNHQGHIVCIAFRGSVGRRCSCSIYDDRPAPCRRFRPGSFECKEARDAAGIEE